MTTTQWPDYYYDYDYDYYYYYYYGNTVHGMRHAGSYFSDQGSNPCPLQWKSGVLTTARPGKPPIISVLQTERELRCQGLAEGQLHKQDQDKARSTFRLPKSRPMWPIYQGRLCETKGKGICVLGWEGKQRGNMRWLSQGVGKIQTRDKQGLWCRHKVPSEWPFEKAANFWSRSNSPLRTVWSYFTSTDAKGWILLPALKSLGLSQACSLVYFRHSGLGHIHRSLERGALPFQFSHVPTIFVLLSKCVKLIPCVGSCYITSFQ